MSADNKHIASCSKDGSLKVFDFNTKREIFNFKENSGKKSLFTYQNNCKLGSMNSLSISQDNRYLVVGSENASIKVFDFTKSFAKHSFDYAHQGEQEILSFYLQS